MLQQVVPERGVAQGVELRKVSLGRSPGGGEANAGYLTPAERIQGDRDQPSQTSEPRETR
jgi:hypothetical protein